MLALIRRHCHRLGWQWRLGSRHRRSYHCPPPYWLVPLQGSFLSFPRCLGGCFIPLGRGGPTSRARND